MWIKVQSPSWVWENLGNIVLMRISEELAREYTSGLQNKQKDIKQRTLGKHQIFICNTKTNWDIRGQYCMKLSCALTIQINYQKWGKVFENKICFLRVKGILFQVRCLGIEKSRRKKCFYLILIFFHSRNNKH